MIIIRKKIENISVFLYKVCYNVRELIQMAKKCIEIIMKDGQEQSIIKVSSIKSSNMIKYIDNNIVSIIKIDNNKLSISRENHEYQLKLNFKEKVKTKGTYLLKLNNMIFDLEIMTDRLIIDKESIYLKYKIDDEEHEIFINEV